MSSVTLKKRTIEASKTTEAPIKKGTVDSTEPSASKEMPTSITLVGRPAGQASAEGTTPKAEDAKPKKSTYEKRMRALAPVVRLRKKLEANAKRLAKVSEELQRWANGPTELRAAATTLTTALASMLAVANALPDNFKPERERKGSARDLVPGAKAVLRAKVAARYDDIIEPDERGNLEIVSIARGGLVSVKTATGTRLVLPRSHVTKAAAG